MDVEPFLTHAVKGALVEDMFANLDKEVCGLITLSDGEYRYEKVENVHEEPAHNFRMDPVARMRLMTDDNVIGYAHSHPNGPNIPTCLDMSVQKRVGKPSVIASVDGERGIVEVFSFGNHLLDAPLIGRDFRYGVMDCYEAIRAWRWQNQGYKMDQYPRHDNWWSADGVEGREPTELNFYQRCYSEQGYVSYEPDFSNPMSERHPRRGDLVLMQMGSDIGIMNHAGIYVGNNLIYEHRLGKKSGEVPVGYRLGTDMIRMWARPENNPDEQ